MARTSLETHNCSVARTLDIIGDQWSLMIIRDAFYGISTFTEFKNRLGIARNVLSDRLEHLVRHEILRKDRIRPDVERYQYKLTERGRELFPILIALVQWGDKWIFGGQGEPIQILDREHDAPIQRMGVISRDGRFLAPRDVTFRPGPGATEDTRAEFMAIKKHGSTEE